MKIPTMLDPNIESGVTYKYYLIIQSITALGIKLLNS